MYWELWAVEEEIISNLDPVTGDYTDVIPKLRRYRLRRGHRQFMCYGTLIDYRLSDDLLVFDLQASLDIPDRNVKIAFPTLMNHPELSELKDNHVHSIGFSIFENPNNLPNTIAQVFDVNQNRVTQILWKKIDDSVN